MFFLQINFLLRVIIQWMLRIYQIKFSAQNLWESKI